MFLVFIAFFYRLIICALYDAYVYIYKVNTDYYYYNTSHMDVQWSESILLIKHNVIQLCVYIATRALYSLGPYKYIIYEHGINSRHLPLSRLTHYKYANLS